MKSTFYACSVAQLCPTFYIWRMVYINVEDACYIWKLIEEILRIFITRKNVSVSIWDNGCSVSLLWYSFHDICVTEQRAFCPMCTEVNTMVPAFENRQSFVARSTAQEIGGQGCNEFLWWGISISLLWVGEDKYNIWKCWSVSFNWKALEPGHLC